MKKLVAVLAIISFNAHAAPDCRELPSCESLGYICSAEECGDLKALSCPFDTSKKICFPKNKDCEVGDTLYNDFMCHDAPCGKIPIAIVFDTENRMAVQLGTDGHPIWGGYGTDIPDLENCTVDAALVDCGTDGKQNTRIIVEYGKANDISYPAAEFCYNMTLGNLPQGSWWLPSAKELHNIWQNFDAVIAGFGRHGKMLTGNLRWSSTEQNLERAVLEYPRQQRVITQPKNYLDGNYRTYCIIGY